MSLALYNRKRDFKKSPEPRSAKEAPEKPKLTFVVHKHDARKLHWDFRLELEGVLKSWAIPRGPSMIAGEKRLAIMVEDHPLQYGKFYGMIPEGNYGAGIVEIWDKGTYKPAYETDDPERNLLEMLKKGDIKLNLNGKYLKGNFALFHLKNEEKDNEWMLVKKADRYAEDVFDIELIPSLKSKKNIEKRKIIKEPRFEPFPDPLPGPMLAKLVNEVNDDPSWIYEMKLDGYRILCSVRDRKIELISRNGKNYSSQYGELLDDLGKIEENVVLDGEVVAENSTGQSKFQLLQNYTDKRIGDLKYYVFDILYMNGHNLMKISLLQRKELIEALFSKYDFTKVLKLEYQRGNGRELFRKLSGEGYEGIIAKDPSGIYVPGSRTGSWLKIKSIRNQEAVICGYTSPKGGRKYFGSFIMGFYEGGTLKYIGCCGTGFDEISLKALYSKFRPIETAICPFGKPPDLSWTKGKPVWLKPVLVASIKFNEWSDDEIMRDPVFLGLRDDKDPGEVVNEMNIKPEAGDESDGSSADGEAKAALSENKVSLTNLDKIYWTDEGITKGDLINYYQKVSRFILPYLKDRPQSLNRHPHGIKGQSFYHKNMDTAHIPEWVKTVRMDSRTHSSGIDYLICNDTATLLYMINLGCIEINPWHSTYRKPDHPTYLMLDLDPGEISFKEVINTALVIREICDETGIQCYCKTSGATGLHIYIPLGAKYDYEQTRIFAEILAVIAHNRLPSVTSLERTVSKRKDKVYIDYLQNRKGQTIAAPYSVRPRPFATVSTPLAWQEVNQNLSPEQFTLRNIEKRLIKTGDLWQPVLKQGISVTRALKAIEKLV